MRPFMMLLKTIGMPTPPSSTAVLPVLLIVKRRARSPPSTDQVRMILRGVPAGRLEVTSLVKCGGVGRGDGAGRSVEGGGDVGPVGRASGTDAEIEVAEMVEGIGGAILEAVTGCVVECRVGLGRQLRDGSGILKDVDAEGRGIQRDLAAIDHRARR